MIAELLLLARRSPCGAGAGIIAAAVLRRGRADHLRRDRPGGHAAAAGDSLLFIAGAMALAGLNVHLFVAIPAAPLRSSATR